MKVLQRALIELTCGLLVATAGAGPALAREDPPPAVDDTHTALRAMLEARVVPAENPKPEPNASEPRPELADLVIAAADGKIMAAVVSLGSVLGMSEKRVLVPVNQIHYAEDAGKPIFRLDLTLEELKALPVFEKKQTGQELFRAVGSAGSTVRARRGSESRIDESSAPNGESPAPAQNDLRMELASVLASAPLHGSDKEFGKVANGAVEIASLRLDYLLVAATHPKGDKKTYVVPFVAVKLVDKEGGVAFEAAKTAEQLFQGVEYVKPNQGFISRETMKRADEFFDIHREGRGERGATAKAREHTDGAVRR
jgi:hypothetical protein